MLPEEDRVRLLHMIEAVQTALKFAENHQRSDLDSDKMLSFALVRATEIIGEAASKMSKETRENTAQIPWRRIIAMRNRLIHAYFDVNHEILWKTVTVELPDLLPQLITMVDQESSP